MFLKPPPARPARLGGETQVGCGIRPSGGLAVNLRKAPQTAAELRVGVALHKRAHH